MKLLFLTHGDFNYSYELDKNFYETFLELGLEVKYFNYISTMEKFGRDKMNEMLLETYKEVKPDVVLALLHEDQIKKQTINQLSDGGAITMNWFADDHWRFDSFTKYWAPLFHYSITTWEGALKKYEEIGYNNVIYSQWAANPAYYKPYDLNKDFEVTFVGAKHGYRPFIIKELKRHGINIECFGRGWADHENIAAINLTFHYLKKEILKIMKSKGRYLPLNFKKFTRDIHGFVSSGGGLISDRVLSAEEMVKMFSRSLINLNFGASSGDPRIKQIKARNFEIPMSGGFCITDYIPELRRYYKFDEEIVVYKTLKELSEKIKYYLKNQDELEQIRQRGYERSLRDHTYTKRFIDIFKKANIKI